MSDAISEEEILEFVGELDSGLSLFPKALFDSDVISLLTVLTAPGDDREAIASAVKAVLHFRSRQNSQGYAAAVLDEVAAEWAVWALRDAPVELVGGSLRRFQGLVLANRTFGVNTSNPQINPVGQGDPNHGATAVDSE